MDFIVKTKEIENLYNLDYEIKKLANGREVIDYQIIPRKTGTYGYGTYVEEYNLVVTCKKLIY